MAKKQVKKTSTTKKTSTKKTSTTKATTKPKAAKVLKKWLSQRMNTLISSRCHCIPVLTNNRKCFFYYR